MRYHVNYMTNYSHYQHAVLLYVYYLRIIVELPAQSRCVIAYRVTQSRSLAATAYSLIYLMIVQPVNRQIIAYICLCKCLLSAVPNMRDTTVVMALSPGVCECLIKD